MKNWHIFIKDGPSGLTPNPNRLQGMENAGKLVAHFNGFVQPVRDYLDKQGLSGEVTEIKALSSHVLVRCSEKIGPEVFDAMKQALSFIRDIADGAQKLPVDLGKPGLKGPAPRK